MKINFVQKYKEFVMPEENLKKLYKRIYTVETIQEGLLLIINRDKEAPCREGNECSVNQ